MEIKILETEEFDIKATIKGDLSASTFLQISDIIKKVSRATPNEQTIAEDVGLPVQKSKPSSISYTPIKWDKEKEMAFVRDCAWYKQHGKNIDKEALMKKYNLPNKRTCESKITYLNYVIHKQLYLDESSKPVLMS